MSEKFPGNPKSAEDQERDAERALDALLDNSENAFLTDVPKNREAIDNAPTAIEALAIAREKIRQRQERTFEFKLMEAVEGVEVGEVNFEGFRHMFDSIKQNQESIGEGEDAIVVIDKNEIREFPPEICYKITKREQTPRGRNSVAAEAEMQSQIATILSAYPDLHVGSPTPFYSIEVGNDKLIAMERLQARSIDDITRGFGSFPKWLDKKQFIEELHKTIEILHEHGIYHRDMHLGNVMIRQSKEPPEDGKWGYIIDFGLTGYSAGHMDPYKKEIAGATFTYNDDHVIVSALERELK